MRLFVFKVFVCQMQCNKFFIANLTGGTKLMLSLVPSCLLLILKFCFSGNLLCAYGGLFAFESSSE